eukprot:256414-Rhodomonas_salina.1
MNSTQALGMSRTGTKQININEDGVNRPGAVEAAWKAANDRLISMQSKLTLAGAVLAQQHLDENPAEEIKEVTTAGTTALAAEVNEQQHKKKCTCFEDADRDSETVTAEQLKAEIAERHGALTALQKTADCKAEGCGLGRGGGRGGRGGKSQGGFIPKGLGSSGREAKQPYKPCSICGGKHPGPIAEDNCFKCDIPARKAALEALEKKKQEVES